MFMIFLYFIISGSDVVWIGSGISRNVYLFLECIWRLRYWLCKQQFPNSRTKPAVKIQQMGSLEAWRKPSQDFWKYVDLAHHWTHTGDMSFDKSSLQHLTSSKTLFLNFGHDTLSSNFLPVGHAAVCYEQTSFHTVRLDHLQNQVFLVKHSLLGS